MKVYSVNLSPFASRIRFAIYAKGLPVEISYPPEGGIKCPEYLALNPMGKMPCLQVEAGVGVPESAVILEYLADKHPEAGLLPGSPENRARIRLVGRITEVYLGAAASVLFGQFNPAVRDQAVVDAQFGKLDEAMGFLEAAMGDGAWAVGDELTLADCTLIPNLFYLTKFIQAFDKPSTMDGHPKLAAYQARALKDPSAAKVWGEMEHAFDHYGKTGQFI